MKEFDNKGVAWALPRAVVLATVIVGLLGFQRVDAQGVGNPLTGYNASTDYFLDYSGTTSFAPGNSNDVQVDVSVDGGAYHSIDVDTGSRGLYESADMLPTNFISGATGSYSGTIALSSSGRDLIGTWVPTTVTLPVSIQQNGITTGSGSVTSSVNVLAVTTLSVASSHTGAPVDFDVTSSAPVNSTLVLANGEGTVTVQQGSGSSANYIALTAGQSINYVDNPGKLADTSNFGIGFDLSGAPGGTGPIADNKNQIYNALINVVPTVSGSYVQGYVVTPYGIQLGLTGSNTGYAYTKLNPTIYTSTNSQPDWQTPMGQTTVSGTTYKSGSIVMDSGIPDAYISAPGLSGTLTQLSVSLINSGGAVGYTIDLSGTSDLNPQADPGNGVAAVQVSAPTLDGTYSQNQPPYQAQFFNTGRNVFQGFDMLYDAEDGYMGLLPTAYGDTLIASGDLSFTPGFYDYIDPVPESQSTVIVLAGLVFCLLRSLKRARDRRRSPLEIATRHGFEP